MNKGANVMHSTLTNPLEQGQHEGYQPGEYDPTTGIHNPTIRGLVRGRYNNPDSIGGTSGHLAHLRQFTGHSIRGIWTKQFGPIDTDRIAYVVLSYATPIAYYEPPTRESEQEGRDLYNQFWMDDDHYGQITSTHQSLVRAWMGHATELRDIDPTTI